MVGLTVLSIGSCGGSNGADAVFHARGSVPKVSQCHALARSGIPPIEPLFNGSLCDDGGALDQFFQRAARYMDTQGASFEASSSDADAVEAIPPLAVPR